MRSAHWCCELARGRGGDNRKSNSASSPTFWIGAVKIHELVLVVTGGGSSGGNALMDKANLSY